MLRNFHKLQNQKKDRDKIPVFDLLEATCAAATTGTTGGATTEATTETTGVTTGVRVVLAIRGSRAHVR